MALDDNNIIYFLLASTILANLDRPIHEKLVDEILLIVKISFLYPSASMSKEKISLNKNIKPLHLTSEISNIELIEAEQKIEEKKEDILENQPPSKQLNVVDKLMRKVWYTRPVSDEGDTSDENHDQKITDDLVEKDIVAPDIDTSHSINVHNENAEIMEEEKPAPIPSWIHDQVYGDKVNRLSFF